LLSDLFDEMMPTFRFSERSLVFVVGAFSLLSLASTESGGRFVQRSLRGGRQLKDRIDDDYDDNYANDDHYDDSIQADDNEVSEYIFF
jgi:hypothetical protein